MYSIYLYMFFGSYATGLTAIIFITVTLLLTVSNCSWFFTKNGQIKSFDLRYSETTTPVPFGLAIYLFLIIIYVILLFVTQLLRKSKIFA